MEIRNVWSLGYSCDGPLPPFVANLLLKQNAKQILGAWQTIETDAKGTIAIFEAQTAADADPQTLYRVLCAVAASADEMEGMLTGGEDCY